MMNSLSPTTLKVLDILNDGKLHPGSDIASALGISRTAVWKIVNRLKNYQVDISAKPQGYLLKEPMILFNQEKLKNLLKPLPLELELFESLSSTHDYLKSNTSSQNVVCLSEYQSGGKGRLGREWVSPFGRNIYCSFLFHFNKDICELSGLSLAVGVLAAKALESIDPKLKPYLKWPNDIYIDNKKLGGILIDLSAEAHGSSRAIISIGLNINMGDVDWVEVDTPWISVEHVLGKKLDRNIIVVNLIERLYRGITVFAEKGLEAFLPEWALYDFLKDQKISLRNGSQVVSGIARGISPQGYLCVELENGEHKTFSCGDTTLRKA